MSFAARASMGFAGPALVTTMVTGSDIRYFSSTTPGGPNGSAIPTIDAEGKAGFPTLGGGICGNFRWAAGISVTAIGIYPPGTKDSNIPSYSHVVVNGTTFALPAHFFTSPYRYYNIPGNPFAISTGTTKTVEFLSNYPVPALTSSFSLAPDTFGYASETWPYGNSPSTLRGAVSNQASLAGHVGMPCKAALAPSVYFYDDFDGMTHRYYFGVDVPLVTMPGGVDAGAAYLTGVKINGVTYGRTSSYMPGGYRNYEFLVPALPSQVNQITIEFL